MFEFIASIIAFFYDLTRSYGVAILLLTVVIRLALLPLMWKQQKSQIGMGKLQPEMKKLQEQYGDDRETLNQEMMKLYKAHGVNPIGCGLPILLQAPIMIGLYRTINGLSRNGDLSGLLIKVKHPQYLSQASEMYRSLVRSGGVMRSFGIDLSQSAQGFAGSWYAPQRLPYILLVVAVAATGYLQQVIANKQQVTPPTGQAAQMQQAMKFLPIVFGFISFNIQAAVVLYWLIGNVWMILQSQLFRKVLPQTAQGSTNAAATLVPEIPSDVTKKDAATTQGSGNSKSSSKSSGKSSGTPATKPVNAAVRPNSSIPKTQPGKQSAIAAAKLAAREGRSRAQQQPQKRSK